MTVGSEVLKLSGYACSGLCFSLDGGRSPSLFLLASDSLVSVLHPQKAVKIEPLDLCNGTQHTGTPSLSLSLSLVLSLSLYFSLHLSLSPFLCIPSLCPSLSKSPLCVDREISTLTSLQTLIFLCAPVPLLLDFWKNDMYMSLPLVTLVYLSIDLFVGASTHMLPPSRFCSLWKLLPTHSNIFHLPP